MAAQRRAWRAESRAWRAEARRDEAERRRHDDLLAEARQEGRALASASSSVSMSTSSAEGDGHCMGHACVLVSHLAAAALRFGRSGG